MYPHTQLHSIQLLQATHCTCLARPAHTTPQAHKAAALQRAIISQNLSAIDAVIAAQWQGPTSPSNSLPDANPLLLALQMRKLEAAKHMLSSLPGDILEALLNAPYQDGCFGTWHLYVKSRLAHFAAADTRPARLPCSHHSRLAHQCPAEFVNIHTKFSVKLTTPAQRAALLRAAASSRSKPCLQAAMKVLLGLRPEHDHQRAYHLHGAPAAEAVTAVTAAEPAFTRGAARVHAPATTSPLPHTRDLTAVPHTRRYRTMWRNDGGPETPVATSPSRAKTPRSKSERRLAFQAPGTPLAAYPPTASLTKYMSSEQSGYDLAHWAAVTDNCCALRAGEYNSDTAFRPPADMAAGGSVRGNALTGEQRSVDGALAAKPSRQFEHPSVQLDGHVHGRLSIAAMGEHGVAPLHIAAASDSVHSLMVLLRNGSSAHMVDAAGWTALHWAAAAGALQAMKILMRKTSGDELGAQEVRSVEQACGLPASSGASRGSSTALHQRTPLSPHGQGTTHGSVQAEYSAMHLAAQAGDVACMQLLASAAQDALHSRDALMRTPLHHAAEHNRAAAVAFLLQHGARHNAKDVCRGTPLHAAAKRGCLAVAVLLLSAGASIACPDQSRATALGYALAAGWKRIAGIMLATQAQRFAQTKPMKCVTRVKRSTRLLRGVSSRSLGSTRRIACSDHDEGLAETVALELLLENVAELAPDELPNAQGMPTEVWRRSTSAALEDLCRMSDQQLVQYMCHTSSADGGSTPAFTSFVQQFVDGPLEMNLAHLAARDGHMPLLVVALRTAPRLSHAPNADQHTPVHVAAQHDQLLSLHAMHTVGVDLQAVDNNQDTPLHWAAFRSSLWAAMYLLLAKPQLLHAQNTDAGTPLHSAANSGDTRVGWALLSLGANPNVQMRDGNAPLHNAAYEGHASFCAALLDRGANADIVNAEQRVPLHEAACNGHTRTVRALARGAGSLPRQWILTSLALALQAIMELPGEALTRQVQHMQGSLGLLGMPACDASATASVHSQDERSSSARRGSNSSSVRNILRTVRRAMRRGKRSPARASTPEPGLSRDDAGRSYSSMDLSPPLSTQHSFRSEASRTMSGIDAQACANEISVACGDLSMNGVLQVQRALANMGLWALHDARWAPSEGDTHVTTCYAHRANVNAQDAGGDTPLHWAVCNGYAPTVRALLLHSASHELHNIDGGLPVHAAVINNKPSTLLALLEFGVNPDTRFRSAASPPTALDSDPAAGLRETPLHVAASDGRLDCLHVLLRAGASLDLLNGNKRSALMEACRNRHLQCAMSLLLAGADPAVTDSSNSTAFGLLMAASSAWLAQLCAPGAPDRGVVHRRFSTWHQHASSADIQLRSSGGLCLPAHRIVLAAHSDAFRAMFTGWCAESSQAEVTLSLSDAALTHMLHWCYHAEFGAGMPLLVQLELLFSAEQWLIPAMSTAVQLYALQHATPPELVVLHAAGQVLELHMLWWGSLRLLSTPEVLRSIMARYRQGATPNASPRRRLEARAGFTKQAQRALNIRHAISRAIAESEELAWSGLSSPVASCMSSPAASFSVKPDIGATPRCISAAASVDADDFWDTEDRTASGAETIVIAPQPALGMSTPSLPNAPVVPAAPGLYSTPHADIGLDLELDNSVRAGVATLDEVVCLPGALLPPATPSSSTPVACLDAHTALDVEPRAVADGSSHEPQRGVWDMCNLRQLTLEVEHQWSSRANSSTSPLLLFAGMVLDILSIDWPDIARRYKLDRQLRISPSTAPRAIEHAALRQRLVAP